MNSRRLTRYAVILSIFTLYTVSASRLSADGEENYVSFKPSPGRLEIRIDDEHFATYVYNDAKVLRPHFSNIQAPGEIQVTRHHPPRVGEDPVDHDTMHPGIWLAFGDLSGKDFWRNRGRVEHVQFVVKPDGGERHGVFTVENRYVADGKTICTEICRHRIRVLDSGILLTYESRFTSDDGFYFGDQEELGLGFRMRTGLQVRDGTGRMLNADGLVNEKQIRGPQSDWCDYSGIIDDQRVGLLLMPSPQNFRRSWFHARDYGFIAANPFGRKALTGGEESRVEVKPGETFKLGFGVFVYAVPEDKPLDYAAVFRDYSK